MKNATLFAFIFVLLTFYSQSARAQTPKGMSPPPPSQQTPLVSVPEPAQQPASVRMDLLEMRKDAAELARTAQSIPTDVENVRKGMLPRDVLLKLKQIEKLSKRLRTELNP